MIQDPARVRFLTSQLEELQGLRKVVGGLPAAVIGVLLGPDAFLGVGLPSAAGWSTGQARLLAGIAAAGAGLLAHRQVKRFYERSYGVVQQPQQGAAAGWPSRAFFPTFVIFWAGASSGWPWLLGLGAMALVLVTVFKWRHDGGIVPSDLLFVLLLPVLTLLLPHSPPVVALMDADIATELVLFGTAVAIGGLLDHLTLLRIFPTRRQDADD